MIKPIVSYFIFARRRLIQRQSLPVKSHRASLDNRAWLNSQNFLNPNPPSLRGQHNEAQGIEKRIRPHIRYWILPKAPHNSIQLFTKPLGELEDRYGVKGDGLSHRFNKTCTVCPRQILAFSTTEIVLDPLLNVIKVLLLVRGEE